jgi:diaminohydroxyphosphoribosylaminopyrimidine deaminase/5-amino-6-(5-phosphoribosylamino)uracil reductase
MNIDEKYMEICLDLAKQGIGKVAPNPMVGCVIVHNNKIIGQGYHEFYGGPHAEVNAVASVTDKALLKESTLYVNLEPCAHFGKTPPCANLIVEHQIQKVVIGCVDTFSEVSGKGIEKLANNDIDVTVGVLKEKSEELNKRFFTFHAKKRPYIILKWAQTQDGFIDVDRKTSPEVNNWITTPVSKKMVHQWRAEEQAIMVGTNTALNDNPSLTVREVDGDNPTRIVLDINLRLPENLIIFDKTVQTIIFNTLKNESTNNLDYVKIEQKNIIPQILKELYNREIQSVIIEGGAQLLNSFIKQNLWNEARVFTGEKTFKKGLKSPQLDKSPTSTTQIDSDILKTYFNA